MHPGNTGYAGHTVGEGWRILAKRRMDGQERAHKSGSWKEGNKERTRRRWYLAAHQEDEECDGGP